jgi:hypothetical protein
MPEIHAMDGAIDSMNAAIDDAARALVTPPPDDGLVSRVVARLPERAVGARRALWGPVAAVGALVAWLAFWPNQPEHAPAPAQQAVLPGTGSWRELVPAPSSVAPAFPRLWAPARAAAAGRPTDPGAQGEAWGLRPIEPLSALVVGGLPSTDSLSAAVAPLAVAALPLPAALPETKE